MAEITFDDVTKRYPDGTEAVKHFDLDVKDGEFMIFVGPSGCGKSTALRMIAGLEDISEGTLRIGGEVVNDRAPRDRDIAMVFQNYALYPHMTVRENMGFALRLRRVDRAQIDRKVSEAAEILDLTEHLDRKPANLSGGQRQRVAMGRAIVRDPKAFLMDEPLSNLDAKLRVQMRTSVAKLQSQLGTTMVYVTHDQVEAMTLGDRVAVMRGGVIQQVDTPRELYEHPTNLFVAGFIGSPAMNFLPGEIGAGEVRTALGTIPLGDQARRRLGDGAPDRRVTVGIRPEHLQDAALVGDQRVGGVSFRTLVEVLEPMGAEVNAYFRSGPGPRTATAGLDAAETADDVSAPGGQMVARLDAETRAVEGEPLELWFDPRRVQLFDPDSGRSLLA